MTAQVRILLIDDHPLVTQGLRALLEPTHKVIGMVHDGDRALDEVRRLKPDLVLLDLLMPGKLGLDVCREIKAEMPSVTVLIVSMQAERIYADEAFRAGASGFVLKLASDRELLSAIEEVMAGRPYRNLGLEQRTRPPHREGEGPNLTDRLHDPLDMLSLRQRQVFVLMGQGKTTREIAEVLGVEIKTVEFHRAKTEKALGLKNARALMRLSMERMSQADAPSLAAVSASAP